MVDIRIFLSAFLKILLANEAQIAIERHKLEPVDGEYQLIDEMLAEAAALDERRGTRPSPEKLAEWKAGVEGMAPGWEKTYDPNDDEPI